MIYICENCSKKHDGTYASGRFCSKICAKGFSTKSKRSLINEKVKITWKSKPKKPQKLYNHICNFCKKEYLSSHNISKYCSRGCLAKGTFLGKTLLPETKLRMKNAALFSYSVGKKVSGGTTKWIDYKDIKVQGKFELRTCFILDKWKEEGKIKDWEYTNDRIKYIGLDEKKHSYLLDFKVFENNGSFYYIETKGYKKNDDELKWKATKRAGYKLEIWFNEDIQKFEK